MIVHNLNQINGHSESNEMNEDPPKTSIQPIVDPAVIKLQQALFSKKLEAINDEPDFEDENAYVSIPGMNQMNASYGLGPHGQIVSQEYTEAAQSISSHPWDATSWVIFLEEVFFPFETLKFLTISPM
jgi:hypothetical protein